MPKGAHFKGIPPKNGFKKGDNARQLVAKKKFTSKEFKQFFDDNLFFSVDTVEAIQKKIEENKYPSWAMPYMVSFIDDIFDKKIFTIEAIVNRIVGKPKETIDINEDKTNNVLIIDWSGKYNNNDNNALPEAARSLPNSQQ